MARKSNNALYISMILEQGANKASKLITNNERDNRLAIRNKVRTDINAEAKKIKFRREKPKVKNVRTKHDILQTLTEYEYLFKHLTKGH